MTRIRKNGIAIVAAKEQLQRIDGALSEPELLIGGIAVNYYVATRRSLDIDLVCTDEVATRLIEKLYPSDRYEIRNGGNEERPTYFIRDTKDRNAHGIVFGPKIVQRGGYQLLDWSTLYETSKPLEVRTTENPGEVVTLHNILVPSPEDLIFTKLISFFGRSETKKEKRLQDLKDIVALANENINARNLFNRIEVTSQESGRDIVFEFMKEIKGDAEVDVLRMSWLFKHLVMEFASGRPTEGDVNYNYHEKTTKFSPALESFIKELIDPEMVYATVHPSGVPKYLSQGESALSDGIVTEFLTLNYEDIDGKSDSEMNFQNIVRRHTFRAEELTEQDGVGLARSSLYIDLHSACTDFGIRHDLANFFWGFIQYLSKKELELQNFTLASPKQGNTILGAAVQDLCHADFLMVRTSPQLPKFGIPIEGEVRVGRPTIIIDDLCMDAHFLLRAVDRIREARGTVDHVVTLLERNDAIGRQKLAEVGVSLHSKYTVNASAYANVTPDRRTR